MLKHVSKVIRYLHIVDNEEDSLMVNQVISMFQRDVLSNFNTLKLGKN